jgi:hypothetical protein
LARELAELVLGNLDGHVRLMMTTKVINGELATDSGREFLKQLAVEDP